MENISFKTIENPDILISGGVAFVLDEKKTLITIYLHSLLIKYFEKDFDGFSDYILFKYLLLEQIEKEHSTLIEQLKESFNILRLKRVFKNEASFYTSKFFIKELLETKEYKDGKVNLFDVLAFCFTKRTKIFSALNKLLGDVDAYNLYTDIRK